MNGVNADSNVNADTAKSVGEKMLASVNGTLTIDYSFKRSAQTITIASKSSVKIEYKYKLTLISGRALHISHSSFRLPIYVKAATKATEATKARCTMGKAYTRG